MKAFKSVATIFERERDFTINEWMRLVNLSNELSTIPLNDPNRMGHLPALFDDILCRLRQDRDAQAVISIVAAAHGNERFAQGYSVPMLVEESRILQVSVFKTLHLHQNELDQDQVLSEVVIIADEADRQLAETVRSFMTAKAAA